MNRLIWLYESLRPQKLLKHALLPVAVGGLCSFASLQAAAQAPVDECGYSLSMGISTSTRFGFTAWVDINNVAGESASEFEILLDTGDTNLQWVLKADYEPAPNGDDYWITEPKWWGDWKDIDPGQSYRFRFRATPALDYVAPYLISINGMPCDTTPPVVGLSSNSSFFTAESTLTLTADASDDAAVMKVVFERDGEVIGEDLAAPFEFDVAVDEGENGYHLYTATAYDPSGNAAVSAPQRIFTSIDNKFLGTAPGGPEDYADLLTYFNQLTPENAGKWGAVESERDVMDWEELDTAYAFAQSNGIAFKYHTLLWGQQQPDWLDGLTPAEQLEEIEEWMSAVAGRYPDLTMIEVVNEPLHAPPAYVEALGGAGETGWDWVINAFELARQYFPEAQLILNDYQILILQDFTDDYLDIITLLQGEGLIDAVGLQAHFLERAELAVVEENLDTLAATGLPLYISEFDLNIANDALHANTFRDLFTLFWEHSAVVGVTHWGHLEGSVWQENAYLLRQDGSQRPALDWLVCYLAGNSGCTVPEYIPSGWQGDEYGLTLQAEQYDEGQGVLALGEAVAYTDDGDWIAFYSVELQSGWDTFSVNYAKGNEEPGSISVHVGSPDSVALLTVELPPTEGGWGNTEELEVPWVSLEGTHDVYIRFNGTYGVANLDSVRFGTPAPEPGYGPNIVANSDFEDGDYYWYSWTASVATSTAYAYSGAASLWMTDNTGNGLLATSLTDVVQPGTQYQVRLYATVSGAATAPVHVTSAIECDGTTAYNWFIPESSVTEGQWTEMTGVLEIPDCELGQVQIFAEGPGAGVDLYLDDVSVREILSGPQTNIFPNGDFEAGNANGWYSWDGGTVGTTTSHVYAGDYALEVTNRGSGAPAAYNWLPLVESGASYSVSMAVSAAKLEQHK